MTKDGEECTETGRRQNRGCLLILFALWECNNCLHSADEEMSHGGADGSHVAV